jgi:hypothetical protein
MLIPYDTLDQRLLAEIWGELQEINRKMFTVKDSGERQRFASGMQRDVTNDKVRYDLVFDGPMVERWAAHLTKGAKKYEPRNWMKACSQAELDRFRESAVRHFVQYIQGDVDEDHAAATIFNINGMEYVKERLRETDH